MGQFFDLTDLLTRTKLGLLLANRLNPGKVIFEKIGQ